MYLVIYLKMVISFQWNCFFISFKYISGVWVIQCSVIFIYCDLVIFWQINNCQFWCDDQQFVNMLFMGFTFMVFWQCVGEVWVDLQWEQIQCIEILWIDNWYIVGGMNSWVSKVSVCVLVNIQSVMFNYVSNWCQQFVFVVLFQ